MGVGVRLSPTGGLVALGSDDAVIRKKEKMNAAGLDGRCIALPIVRQQRRNKVGETGTETAKMRERLFASLLAPNLPSFGCRRPAYTNPVTVR